MFDVGSGVWGVGRVMCVVGHVTIFTAIGRWCGLWACTTCHVPHGMYHMACTHVPFVGEGMMPGHWAAEVAKQAVSTCDAVCGVVCVAWCDVLVGVWWVGGV